jgi:hypothetical protein
MFKRVGKEIRTWAKVLVILEMIPIVLAGILCALYFIEEGPGEEFIVIGILCGILIIVLGYFLARLSAIILYSWGELVERVVCIDERLEKMEQRPVAPAVPAAPVAPVAPPAYSYPPVAPIAPVAPVKNTTVNTPAMNVPIASVPVNDPVLEDEYTVAARPAPAKTGEWTCPNCGQKNNADGNWCRNCGTKKSV